MAGTTYSATLDGVHNFTINGDNFSWGSNGYLSSVDEWGGDGPTVNTFNLTFQGGGWNVGNLHLGGWAKTNIVDSLDGLDRNIETLRLSGIGGTVNLTTTHVEVLKMFWIDGAGGTNITFGSAGADEVLLNNRDDTVRGGSGWLDDVRLGGGNNLFVAGSGGSRIVRGNDGNDTVTGGAGNIDIVSLNGGNNVVNGGSGFIAMIRTFGGNDRVTLLGGAEAISLGSGNNTVTTGAGNIQSLSSVGGNNTLNIGIGGVQQIALSGDGTQQITAQGFIGSLNVSDNSATTLNFLGSAGAGAVQLGDGDDVVTTGTGYVQLINLGDGNNTLVMGTGGGGFVRGGNGDDVFKMNTLNPQYGVVLQGGLGANTVDFSQIGAKLTISLARYDYQNIGGPGGDGDPVLGYFSLVQIINLTGGTGNDKLTGNTDSNVLIGLAGADVMKGLDGNDTIFGGKGNDTLTGGTGADQFEFAAGGGADRITDFTLASDHIHFAGTTRLADITFATQGTGVLLTFGTTSVLVDSVTQAQLHDAANFVFG